MTERRYDPVSGEWRTFAPAPPTGGDGCAFCGGAFEAAVIEARLASAEPLVGGSELYPVAPSVGVTEVVVYSTDHDLGLAEMEVARLARIVEVWADRYSELGGRDDVAYVFIFEDRTGVGHPHGEIHAYPDIPPRARRELDVATAHIEDYGTCVYCDVVARERSDGVRVVAHSRSFLAFVPFAARFPYELHVTSLRHAASLLDLTDPERLALAQVIRAVVRGYDRLFGSPLPYVMSMHQAPTDDGEHQHVSHFHIEFTPTRPPAGPELGAGAFISDTAPEQTAARLRAAVGGRGDHS
ncbi:MAG: galactose-1-phosphate uridylyltransferase [Actinomycetota bacterium]|nr:galactose-1-phosphate uridylyltransferase [Actinomycetota bacterium]